MLKRLGGGSWNLVTFNINLFCIKKVIFGSLDSLVLPWQRVCQEVLKIFLSYCSIFFLITKFLKFSKVKSILIFEKSQNTSKYQIWAKSVRRFGSYEHLKFRPMIWLKYRLWRHNDVIVVMSQFFVNNCVEYIKLDACAKFHDHWSNKRQSYDWAPYAPPPP